MRVSLGIAVLSGMIGVTLFGIFLTPVFYYVLTAFGGKETQAAKARSSGGNVCLSLACASGL
jgi:hypothetical protein